MKNKSVRLIAAGAAAGIITGTFGAGGGLVLVPLLGRFVGIDEKDIFPASVCIMLSVSITAFLISAHGTEVPWAVAAPYLTGGIIGGTVSGLIGKKVPVLWLHRILGAMLLYGGLRYLCR